MKKNILLLSICCLLTIGGCNGGNNSSSKVTENITGVEIVGPTSVLVGKTIRLTADVLGSDNDDVSWSSSDTSIATVNNEGVVSGISEGSVEIIATSIKDPTKSVSYTINVTLPKANEISLFIEENENVSYDNTNDIYTVFLGQTFYIDTSILPLDTKQPDITYSVTYPDGSEDTSVSLEIIPDTTRAKVISYKIFDGLIITATGKYSDLATENLKASIEIDVIDRNLDKYTDVLSIVNNLKEKENNELVSSKLTRTKSTTVNDITTTKNEVLKHHSYLNATYVENNIKTLVDDRLENEETINYYQGINTIDANNYFYTFKYDENQKITELYNSTNNIEEIGLMFDVHSSITYGYYNILNNILSSGTKLYEGDIISFGNTYAYAYADFNIGTDNFSITSICFDEDYDINYKLSLNVTYTQNTLTGYTFIEEIDDGISSTIYTETASDFIYDTKISDSVANNDNFLDLNQYYVDDYEIVQFNEKDPDDSYDYTNLDKYGAIKGNEGDLVKYTTTYDKTIVLKANPLSPSTANINFDNIKVTSSNNEQVPSVSSIFDGIFAINAAKNDDGDSLPGKATFTFKSTKGVTKQIVIEFVDAILESVNVDTNNVATYDENTDTYLFDSIFVDKYSDYFFINTTPDESKYSFDINIITGENDGINLVKHEKGNEFGYPDYSYSILGHKPGTYTFKIFVVDHEDVQSEETFKIEIKEVYSKEFIAQNIVGETYEYYGSTTTYSFTFTSETQLDYSETFLDEVKSTSFTYHIEDGAIVVDETQSFSNGMYFSRLSKGNINFSDDFSSIFPYIEIYDSSALPNINRFTYYFEFKHLFNIETIDSIGTYINGKTFDNEEGNLSVEFNNGEGILTFKDYNNNVLAVFTFNYVFDDVTNTLAISNSSSSNTKYTLLDSSCSFDYYSLEFVFKIQTNTAYPYSDTYYININ